MTNSKDKALEEL